MIVNSLFWGLYPHGEDCKIAVLAGVKKCPSILWVLDLWPDTLEALDILKKKWQLNYFKILINWIYKRICSSSAIYDITMHFYYIPRVIKFDDLISI